MLQFAFFSQKEKVRLREHKVNSTTNMNYVLSLCTD